MSDINTNIVVSIVAVGIGLGTYSFFNGPLVDQYNRQQTEAAKKAPAKTVSDASIETDVPITPSADTEPTQGGLSSDDVLNKDVVAETESEAPSDDGEQDVPNTELQEPETVEPEIYPEEDSSVMQQSQTPSTKNAVTEDVSAELRPRPSGDKAASDPDTDPYLWLEEVEGDRALAWVNEQNADSKQRLADDPRFEGLMNKSLAVYNASDKIAYGRMQGGDVHNIWQDETNERGLWRRSTLGDYTANIGNWETILDFDKLAADEGENWVYKGRDCSFNPNLCLVSLSRGGGDAVVQREYNVYRKQWVENGFNAPESKQFIAWAARNSLLIATDFGEGTMNTSGYPRQVRLWKRGAPLNTSKLLFEAPADHTFVLPIASHRSDGVYAGVIQGPDFFTEIIHLMQRGKMKKLDLPLEIQHQGFFRDWMILQMRADWTTGDKFVTAGSLVAIKVSDLLADTAANSLTTLHAPTPSTAIDEIKIGADRILITVLDDVKGKLVAISSEDDAWSSTEISLPENGKVSIVSVDEESDDAFINFESFIQPDTLYHLNKAGDLNIVASLPDRFDSSNLVTEQKFAISKDGTSIPYFVVRHADTILDGKTPTLLYGYGGFEISITPSYLTGTGQLWLEEGGAYVVANIRGGGEYGPNWHQSVLKEKRQGAYDDFIAVAEDIITSGLTSPRHLGIRGGSNGGLLMGAMLTQRPDLFNAVICAVPLLDMMRYHKLLAGASWMGEYGNPDIAEERAYILKYSPYQNVHADTAYPEIFFYTSTKDDRVHPGHARKMAAKMADQGHPIIYYENTEGGHSAAANLKQRAYSDAMQIIYALQKLKD